MSPDAVTAFVVVYEESQGGASVNALTPGGITAMIARYLEAEGVDVSALTPEQIEGIVSRYAEAKGCDRSELLKSFTAYVTEYREANGITYPQPKVRVMITGYDYLGYRKFSENNPDLNTRGRYFCVQYFLTMPNVGPVVRLICHIERPASLSIGISSPSLKRFISPPKHIA